jgi:hypothetical protein
MELRFDKRGKPYYRTTCCSTRAFMSSEAALRSVATLLPLADQPELADALTGAGGTSALASFKRALFPQRAAPSTSGDLVSFAPMAVAR